MKKQDAPRLKTFISRIMKAKFTDIPCEDMIKTVHDLEWLAKVAIDLEKEIKPIGPAKPLPPEKKTRKKNG